MALSDFQLKLLLITSLVVAVSLLSFSLAIFLVGVPSWAGHVKHIQENSPALNKKTKDGQAYFESVMAAQRAGASERHKNAARVRAASRFTDPKFEVWKKERGALVQGEAREEARRNAPKHLHAGHQYAIGQAIQVFGEQAGPISGGATGKEVVDLFDVPWFNCGKPRENAERDDEGSYSLFQISYRQRTMKQKVQRCQLTGEQVTKLHRAIKDRWFFEVELDGLPVHGFIGIVDPKGAVKLFKHIDLQIDYNADENRIVYAHALTFNHAGMQTIQPGQAAAVEFTVTTTWEKTDYSSADRALRYMKNDFFNQLDVSVEFETD